MSDLLQTVFRLDHKAHWYPLIWLVLMGLPLSRMPKRRELVCGREEKRWHPFPALLLVLPLILWSGLRSGIGDTYAYILSFQCAPSSLQELLPMLNADSRDPGFSVLMTLFKSLGVSHHQVFFLCVAAFQMLCIARTFRRYSSHYWLSIFLFVVSTDYISWMFNGMRQFLAVTMIFAATGLLLRRKYAAYAAVVLLAAQIHGSAIVMLPLAFIMTGPAFNRKTLLMVAAAFLILPVIDRITPLLDHLLSSTQYSGTVTGGIWTADDGTNPIRVLVYSVPALVAVIGQKYIRRANDPVMNLCVNASLITMAIYLVSMVTSGIYVGRLPVYTTFYGYLSLPWSIDLIFEKESARFLKLMMVLCYLAFFYVQMHFTWGFF